LDGTELIKVRSFVHYNIFSDFFNDSNLHHL